MRFHTGVLARIALAALLLLAIALVVARTGDSATASTSTVKSGSARQDVDSFSAEIEAGEYLLNPDMSPREIFTNMGPATGLTIMGAKNLETAADRLGGVGPIEIRAGAGAHKIQVLGSIPRDQPFFSVRVRLPAGSSAAAVPVYLWNSDRSTPARISWKVRVD